MPEEDAARWNERYQNSPKDWYASPRSVMIRSANMFNHPGLALDLAMGMGNNAAYLIHLGWKVVGIDISYVAVQAAKKNYPSLLAVLADLDEFRFPAEQFDLILNLYFLDRTWWKEFLRILKPGGLVIIETLLDDISKIQPNIRKNHLLKKGELLQGFSGWMIDEYFEGWVESDHGNQKAIARIIARKPISLRFQPGSEPEKDR